ncbi:hypothetical protein BV902_12805 [Sphingobacterium sp. B29]|nr:hypothetical protein BV902_12805 [Sphingobacterium sp. B29]
MELIKAKILEYLSSLDQLPKKVKDFDKQRFRIDMKNLLEQTDDINVSIREIIRYIIYIYKCHLT